MQFLQSSFSHSRGPVPPLPAAGFFDTADAVVRSRPRPHAWPSSALAHGSLHKRSAFRLVATYLEGCDAGIPAGRLAMTVSALVELARIDFAATAQSRKGGRRFDAESRRCLDDLDALVQRLAADPGPAGRDHRHALDTLVALLVRTGSAGGARA